MVVLYVLDVPEFRPIVEAARARGNCSISNSDKGYHRIESPDEIVLNLTGHEDEARCLVRHFHGWPQWRDRGIRAGRGSDHRHQPAALSPLTRSGTSSLSVPTGDLYAWDAKSTYVKHPPYFEGMTREPGAIADITDARVLLVLGDSITTDHISPAGAIKKSGPAGQYLLERGVDVKDFNQYGARRGNDEVMVRGTFANVRLRNLLAPGTEGGVTRHLPGGEPMSVYDAAVRYAKEGVPLFVLAGKEYGSGSSRDWAAKGPKLLGVRAVLAESYERIHRSNLVGMGILPLEYLPGESAATLGLSGEESFSVVGVATALANPARKQVTVQVKGADGTAREVRVTLRIDTPQEAEYYRHGGILQYVLRQLLRN